jgi:hypothetical protein
MVSVSCVMCHREFTKWSGVAVHFNRHHYNEYAELLKKRIKSK